MFVLLYIFLLWLVLTVTGPLWIVLTKRVDLKADYRTADRSSARLAPRPHETQDAVIQAYAARAFNWRGIVASHCWIAMKPRGAFEYTVYQVMGWRTLHNLPALAIGQDIPDRNWYGEKPNLMLDVRGSKAEALIPKIHEAAMRYIYARPYVLWPGPNSNTFPAFIGREFPELGLALPADALGKDFISRTTYFAKTPSGTGYQLTFRGMLGVLLARKEGIEINILGLVYGIKFYPFKILLPGFR